MNISCGRKAAVESQATSKNKQKTYNVVVVENAGQVVQTEAICEPTPFVYKQNGERERVAFERKCEGEKVTVKWCMHPSTKKDCQTTEAVVLYNALTEHPKKPSWQGNWRNWCEYKKAIYAEQKGYTGSCAELCNTNSKKHWEPCYDKCNKQKIYADGCFSLCFEKEKKDREACFASFCYGRENAGTWFSRYVPCIDNELLGFDSQFKVGDKVIVSFLENVATGKIALEKGIKLLKYLEMKMPKPEKTKN
ncbi:hypothetical protein KJ885_00455 [Patescibacteria group bacterium]|nr:hypothetical protein [Patescibacteria group bacterium]